MIGILPIAIFMVSALPLAATFLTVPTVTASAGAWPLPSGSSVGDQDEAPTGAASKTYWPGFQPRWALGLELKRDAAQGQSAAR
jgi:hypothetical protein